MLNHVHDTISVDSHTDAVWVYQTSKQRHTTKHWAHDSWHYLEERNHSKRNKDETCTLAVKCLLVRIMFLLSLSLCSFLFYYAMLTIFDNTIDSVKHEHKTRTKFYFVCSRRLPALKALKITWNEPHTHVTTKIPSYVTTWIYLIAVLCSRIIHFII